MKNFELNEEFNIFIRPGAPPLNYSDGGEEYLLNIFKNLKEIKSYSPELVTYIKDWPTRYHLSLRRTNIMEAASELFNKNIDCLELGAGCGAITRWLGQKFRSVDAVEGSIARAHVTRERTRDLPNVNIFCGDMLDISFPRGKYGLATLIGVMEYIPFYDKNNSDHKKACVNFLKRVNTSLKKDGALVIAIENKLGAKYFSGCSEDHSRLFEGLNGYPNRTPVTFSRNELNEILLNSGFNNIQFYHAFPDYKLPETIIREADEILSLYPHNWIRGLFEDYSGSRHFIIPDPLLLKTIVESRLLWHFSNSFLVFASSSKKVRLQTEWLIKKFFNNDLFKSVYHHTITLSKGRNPDYLVKRKRMLRHKIDSEPSDLRFKIIATDKIIPGELLIFDMYKALVSDKPWEAVNQILKQVHYELLKNYSLNKTDENGYHLVTGNTVDFVVWNLIKLPNGGLRFIDTKWTFKEELSADFVLFRSLWGIFSSFAPFIKQKDVSLWTIELMKHIYPNYDSDRFKINLRLEESFESAVHTRPISLDVSKIRPRYALTEHLQKLQNETEAMIKSLSLKDGQLAEKVKQLQEKVDNLTAKDKLLFEKNRQLEQKDSELAEKEKHLIERNVELRKKCEQLSELDNQFKAKSLELVAKDEELIHVSKQLNEKNAQIQLGEENLTLLQKELSDKDREFRKKCEQFVEVDGQFKAKCLEVTMKDQELMRFSEERSAEKQHFDSHIREMNVRLLAREQQLKQIGEEIARESSLVEERTWAINERSLKQNEEFQTEFQNISLWLKEFQQSKIKWDEEKRDYERRLREKEQLINIVLDSLSWKITAPLRAVYDFLWKKT